MNTKYHRRLKVSTPLTVEACVRRVCCRLHVRLLPLLDHTDVFKFNVVHPSPS